MILSINNSLAKCRLSGSSRHQELRLLGVSSLMRLLHGWQILASQPWAPMQRGRWAPVTLIQFIIIQRKQGRVVGGKQTRNYGQTQNATTTNTRDTCACGQQKTIDCTGLPVLAQGMHWCRCKNEHAKCKLQGNADPVGCTGTNALQNTDEHEGMLT